MIRRRIPCRTFVVALVTTALLASAGATGAASAASRRVVTMPRCGVLSLMGELRGASAGAGSRFLTIVLTNVTRRSCTLFGYPGLSLLDGRNRALPTHVVRDHSRTPRVVVLAPGQVARSALRWGAIPGPGEPQSDRCEPNPVRVAITPPGMGQRLVLPWRQGSVCEHGTIDVRPLR
jgi:hypothetical protein